MRKIPTWLAALLAVGAVALAVLALVAAAGRVPLGDMAGRWSGRASLVVLVYAAAVVTALFGAFLSLGIEEPPGERSDLYTPLVVATGSLYAYLVIVGGEATDMLLHDNRARWHWLYAPAVRILADLLLLGFVAGLAWLLAVLLIRGRGLPPRRVWTAFAVVALAIAAALAVAFTLAHPQLH